MKEKVLIGIMFGLLAGIEIYNENGDLEGFFLTYTRDIACT